MVPRSRATELICFPAQDFLITMLGGCFFGGESSGGFVARALFWRILGGAQMATRESQTPSKKALYDAIVHTTHHHSNKDNSRISRRRG